MAKNKSKNILLGVCAGVAAYKSCELVRLLVKADFKVKVVMTESAQKFIAPLTFQTLSLNPVYSDMFAMFGQENIKHVSLAQWADLSVIAPATANTISKVAWGVCDNLLTTLICALKPKTKVLFAPAMNTQMWVNPIIQANVKKLQDLKKYIFLQPGQGGLACGDSGVGRMVEAQEIFQHICKLTK